jgi:predicted RNase H-like HicB family nuclease
MEVAFSVHVELLPEGFFLAKSDELPGLVAQGRTIAEALEIARDVGKKLIEARQERDGLQKLPAASDFHDYKIVVGA